MKLLLTSVFGPFGVDDQFGRKENVMELFHNQVTKEQGLFSLRMNHPSFGLHLMAKNIKIPTIVIDFPSLNRFIQEIKKYYDYIGISFIVPNFAKAKKMAELIRYYAPQTKIILGGHGTSIKQIEKFIPCDDVCRGDGIFFLRNLFGEDANEEIKHPLIKSSFNNHVMGAPWKSDAGLISTGVGCVNGCRFCSTTHYFKKKYTPFLDTGQQIFDVCERFEQQGITEFFVMDENFLKSENRAKELLFQMEKHNKPYSFGIFSSAETVLKMGLDFIERLGVTFLWMGVESKKEIYEKNKDVDFKKLVLDLKNRGVSVLASSILFLEHHNKESVREDIDFTTDLNADFVQFMQLGPLPGTALYEEYDLNNKLLKKKIPFEEWHGQHKIWFDHPQFTREESRQYLKYAFDQDFQINGPSILRMIGTTFERIMSSQKQIDDPFMKKRYLKNRDNAIHLYPLVDSLCSHAPNEKARKLACITRDKYDEFFGKRSVSLWLKSILVDKWFMPKEIRLSKNPLRKIVQPGLKITKYNF